MARDMCPMCGKKSCDCVSLFEKLETKVKTAKPKTEIRYKVRASHPEFERYGIRVGDQLTRESGDEMKRVDTTKLLDFGEDMIELMCKDKYLEQFTYEYPLPANKDIIFANGVTCEPSNFDTKGGCVSFKIPKRCDMVIVMGNKGGGFVPLRAMLPHQVYLNDLRKEAKKEGWEVFYILPFKSSDVFNLAYNGDYGKKRWE